MILFFIGLLVGFAMYYVALHIDDDFRHNTLEHLEHYLKKRNQKKGTNV